VLGSTHSHHLSPRRLKGPAVSINGEKMSIYVKQKKIQSLYAYYFQSSYLLGPASFVLCAIET
jgi:hypothetical protein